jgi:hypothetical protein
LQLAIVLLSLFACCLAGATALESACSTRVAQDLVYHTWWFALLLALLAVNVLGAAIKKYPWKRHQTGFLITHAGLLVLVLGGLLTTLAGSEGQMLLIDSDDPDVQQSFHLPNRSDTIQLVDQHRLEVFRVPDHPDPGDPALRAMTLVLEGGVEAAGELLQDLKGHYTAIDFSPGALAWHADEHFQPDLPWSLRLLQFLADPCPSFRRAAGEAMLTVHNFYPHTESKPFSAAAPDENGFPALRLRLSTPLAPEPMERWVTPLPAPEREQGPIGLEMIVLPEPVLLPEFLTPPPPTKMGKLGEIVLAVGRERKVCRLALDGLKAGQAVDLPGTDLRFTLRKCADLMTLLDHKTDSGPNVPSSYPSVQFELSGPGGKGRYLACARLPQMPAWQEGERALVSAWYHVPDWRWGDPDKMGALQFLKGPDGALYYRVYGKDGLRAQGQKLGTTDPEQSFALPWKPMDMRFAVAEYLPHAIDRPAVVPRRLRPGAEAPEELQPALACSLEWQGHREEFRVRLSRQPLQVRVGDALFLVRYRAASRPADFALTLKKAQQVSDPGTNRPASFQSDVVLGVKEEGQWTQSEHTISMNQTLDHGPYKVYQANYRPLTEPNTGQVVLDRHGQVVSLSGLTVAQDPGLPFKYAGSGLLVVGIATMFFMRAYFFKRRSTPLAV